MKVCLNILTSDSLIEYLSQWRSEFYNIVCAPPLFILCYFS